MDLLDTEDGPMMIVLGALNQTLRNMCGEKIEGCYAYGVVVVAVNAETEDNLSYMVSFKNDDTCSYKIEKFDNKKNLSNGAVVYYYEDKADAIVRATLDDEEFIDEGEL